MTNRAHLELQGDLDHLRAVWQLGEAVLESVCWPEDPEGSNYHLLLALQELLTNVIRHAYDGRQHKPITVTFEVSQEQVEIVLRDQGEEFNPLQHGGHEVLGDDGAEDEFPEEAGGYGIHIARVVLDDMWYSRQDGWNELRMFKKVSSGATSTKRSDEEQDFA